MFVPDFHADFLEGLLVHAENLNAAIANVVLLILIVGKLCACDEGAHGGIAFGERFLGGQFHFAFVA